MHFLFWWVRCILISNIQAMPITKISYGQNCLLSLSLFQHIYVGLLGQPPSHFVQSHLQFRAEPEYASIIWGMKAFQHNFRIMGTYFRIIR